MKVEFKEQVVREVDIKLPYYSKDICHFYKILAENHMVQVTETTRENGDGIDEHDFTTMALMKDCIPSTQEEFEAAFNRVYARIKERAGV